MRTKTSCSRWRRQLSPDPCRQYRRDGRPRGYGAAAYLELPALAARLRAAAHWQAQKVCDGVILANDITSASQRSQTAFSASLTSSMFTSLIVPSSSLIIRSSSLLV